MTIRFFEKTQSNLFLLVSSLLVLVFLVCELPLLADQSAGRSAVNWAALEKTEKQQERELKLLRTRWKKESARLKRELAQAGLPNTFEEAWEQIHRDIEIDRVTETLEIMEIELAIARDFTKERAARAPLAVEQNRKHLDGLRKRIEKLARRGNNAPSR